MRKYLKAIPLALALACVGSGIAQAASLDDILSGVQVDGKVRAYRFTRQFTPNVSPHNDVNAFSLAGILNMHTDQAADGWGFGASAFTAQSLGLNVHNPDSTLMGTKNQITAVGQLYLQYRQPLWMVRAGDQELSTPWMSGSDSRVLPATYQAVLLQINPIDHLHVYALRETAWKSRTSSNYFQNNLYYQSTWGGDDSHGGQPYTIGGTTPETAQKSSGTLAIGADYKANGLNARLWYYDFYRFANTYYGEATYTYKTGSGFDPFIGIQGLKQNLSYTDSFFGQYSAAPNGVAGDVNSQVLGAKIGVNVPHGQIFVAYDKVDYKANDFGGGVIISPFTANYATDPLWTTSMIRGLVELGPGNAVKVKGTYKLFDNHLRLMAAWARYQTHFKGNSTNTYGDITWFFGGAYKGLSLRDRIEVAHGALANGHNINTFVYNRVMAEYDF
jgi:hypothetical protein